MEEMKDDERNHIDILTPKQIRRERLLDILMIILVLVFPFILGLLLHLLGLC